MQVNELNEKFGWISAESALIEVNKLGFRNVFFSTSFGQEDQVLTSLIAKNELPFEIFTLDTGRLFQETYELIDSTRTRFKVPIKSYFPDNKQVEELVSNKGANSFYESIDNRKECCAIRKIVPLKRALTNADIWLTGLRAEQSENRASMKMFEWDDSFKVIKFNPLINMTYHEVLEYIKENKIPDNPLHKKGFISIGCAPCTRAIQPNEHPRAGRWWWEESKKECGLHSK